MTESGTEPTFRSYLQILLHRKWWVGSIAVLGLATSLAFSLTAHKEYSATAQLLVQPSINTSGLSTAEQPITQTDVETELQLVTSAPVQQAVRNRLGSAPAVSAAEVGQTNVIAVTANSQVPSHAALVANLYASAFVQYQQAVATQQLAAAEAQLRSQISSLGKQLNSFRGNDTSPEASALANQEAVLKEQLAQMQVSGAVDTGGVTVVTPAQTPASPSSPRPLRDGLLGLAAGLALGLGAAFLRDSLDDGLSSKEAVEHAAGVPVLVMVPSVSSRRRQKRVVVSATQPTSPAAESYRSLRTSLQFARQQRQLHIVMLTSPGVGDGKTSTAANLGLVFAQAGERVLLVSCDLRRPMLGQFFGLDERPGLTDVLRGQQTLDEVLLPVPGVDGLTLLPAGQVPQDPAELLGDTRARDIFAKLRENYDLVLIDSSPLLPVTDAAILSRYADATLMIVAADQTRSADLRRAMEKLDQISATILGVVLNKVTKQNGYGYGYGYGYKPYSSEAPVAQAAHTNGNSRAAHRSPQ
jgi:succinoglycan biosynthesis transport protein ExoP